MEGICEPRWAQSDYWSLPPPPGPHLAKDVLKKIDKNVHQITYIFYILLSFGVILRCLWGLEAYIYNVYEFCWPMYADLGRPGDTFAVAGDRAI